MAKCGTVTVAVIGVLLACLVAAIQLVPRDSTAGAFIDGVLQSRTRSRAARAVLKAETSLATQTILITGGNRGLGRGIAVAFAARGADVIVACRNPSQEIVDGITSEAKDSPLALTKTLVPRVRTVTLDLADHDSVRACVDSLEASGGSIDIVVANAAVVPSKTTLTKHGFEAGFGVNCLGHYLLITELLQRGIVPNQSFCTNPDEGSNSKQPQDDDDGDSSNSGTKLPRVIVVTSEAHRDSRPLLAMPLGTVPQYGLSEAMDWYSYSKMCLLSTAMELARRTNTSSSLPEDCAADGDGAARPDILVGSICPGPVNTDIGRDAPWFLQPVLNAFLWACFADPLEAALPVAEMAVADGMWSGQYRHMGVVKAPKREALDPAVGSDVWQQLGGLVERVQS